MRFLHFFLDWSSLHGPKGLRTGCYTFWNHLVGLRQDLIICLYVGIDLVQLPFFQILVTIEETKDPTDDQLTTKVGHFKSQKLQSI